MEAEEELQVEVDCGKTDKLTVELKLGHAEIFVSGLRYKIAIAFTSNTIKETIRVCVRSVRSFFVTLHFKNH